MTKKHYFVFCMGVVHIRDKIERTRTLNVMLATNDGNITRGALATVQHQAGVRFKSEFDPHGKSEIKDMVMMSVIPCGHMTEAEFHAGFEMPQQEGETEVEEIHVDEADAPGSDDRGTAPADPAEAAGSSGDATEDETRG